MLILTWSAIISFVIIMYVLLDGFDLGIGILFPWVKSTADRDIMMSTIEPVWDGNETWLVLGGAGLYCAFPVAYSTLLPALYMPIMAMLAALIFRGVAFEFRFKAQQKSRVLWSIAFSAGSTIAAFSQGIILGTFVQGYGTTYPFEVSAYEWLTPFSFMTGVAVVCGYALLGSTWLITKTTGDLQNHMYRLARYLYALLVLFLIIVSIWSPFIDPDIKQRWFSLPNFFYLSPLPILTGIAAIYGFYALQKRHEKSPFVVSILLFIFAYIGFCISSYPYIIPRAVTIWQAASNRSSLIFALVGVAILLPTLLGYTFYQYRIFRGKITSSEGHY